MVRVVQQTAKPNRRRERDVRSIISDIKYSIWLYFLPVTNPKAAWRMLCALSQH